MMLSPANCDQFLTLLTAHFLSGGVILNGVQQGVGQYEITAVSGDMLVAVPTGGATTIQSESVNLGVITTADMTRLNGVFQVINAVLAPE